MKLIETVEMMNSNDFKERARIETLAYKRDLNRKNNKRVNLAL